MTIRVAVAGFQHSHILTLCRHIRETEGIEIVAACERNPATRAQMMEQGVADIQFGELEPLLDTVDVDVVAVGDYYGRRGQLILRALERGKHVIGDKPLCTRLEELDQIEKLAHERGLKVGCMLDMRDSAPFRGVRDLVQRQAIGPVHAIWFGGQHPLLLGKRPQWYFEQGKHGGTINDIGIHALDIIPWITGQRFESVVAARCWNALAPETPWFEDAGQMMLTMSNGCGVMGDVSYFAPNSSGYSLAFYWRMTLWGTKGVIETSIVSESISLALDGEAEARPVPLPEGNPGGYLRAFMRDLAGESDGTGLDTSQVLEAARVALSVQAAADLHQAFVPL